MNPTNQNHIPLPRLREMFNQTIGTNSDLESWLDISLNAPDSHFRLLHHLLIAKYSPITMHHRDTPIPLVGLDIETNHLTGEPKLLGYSSPDGFYSYDVNPSLESLFNKIRGIIDNSERGTGIVTWGQLDINCLIRLFSPTKEEQTFISKGYGGKFRNGQWITRPPLLRQVNGAEFCIDHYISGRSLRLSTVIDGWYRTIWVYNLSQFYPSRIADTAKSLSFDWAEYDKETHLVDWKRFEKASRYHTVVLKSNEQDARTVRMMADHLQAIFHQVFKAYPGLLVSAGSLADAAVSKMLSIPDYESNSWQYLKYSTFGKNTPTVRLAESLISEAYSAGYVDQFTIGYHSNAYTADISSAYPHKIRMLPDLRECIMFMGTGDTYETRRSLKAQGLSIFTVVFRGRINIPEVLEYHPITIKTSQKQNIRPLGTFRAAYYLEEREFCESHGATFQDEEWVIFALKERKQAPIAGVSLKLAEMRDEYRQMLKDSSTTEEIIFYDSLQNMVKVVDNSLYGKNVMATEIVEDIDGKPVITGLKAGDRFNQLYGGWITACTRVQIARACMEIAAKGGQPVMAMTDAVYWTGKLTDLPHDMISFSGKQAGLFEPPEKVDDFFVIKTGQYEYSHPDAKSPTGKHFYHKLRGLNLKRDDDDEVFMSSNSFYRRIITEWLEDKSPYMHPEDVEIPVDTRKLVTIGMPNLERLGLVADGIAKMKPFVLSGKQVERFVMDYHKTLNDSIRLKPPVASQGMDQDSPLEFLSGLNEQGGDYVTKHERKRIFYLLIVKLTGMTIRNKFHGQMPKEKVRLTEISWDELERWSGIKREWAHL